MDWDEYNHIGCSDIEVNGSEKQIEEEYEIARKTQEIREYA